MEIEALQRKAARLSEIRAVITAKEEEVKLALEPLKAERDALQDELLKDMEATNLATVKLATGENYIRSIRKGVIIKPLAMAQAIEWAKEHDAVSIDRQALARKLKDTPELPDCFERVETPYISIRKAKEEN